MQFAPQCVLSLARHSSQEVGTYPVRLSSGHCCTPEGCRAPVPGRPGCCPGGRQSGCCHLCSRVWHGQEGELWPLAPPQEPCLLGKQRVIVIASSIRCGPHEEGHPKLTAPMVSKRCFRLLLVGKTFN